MPIRLFICIRGHETERILFGEQDNLQRFLGPNARVLFLVHMGINTGISTVATNDCAMLKANRHTVLLPEEY